MTDHTVEIAVLRRDVDELTSACLTLFHAVRQLMDDKERRDRQPSLVDALLGNHQGFLDGPHALTTRTATEAAMQRRIRRAALYRPEKEES